jgi:hypothetical protein
LTLSVAARRLCERHGLATIQLTDRQDNQERCPDVLYELGPVGVAC